MKTVKKLLRNELYSFFTMNNFAKKKKGKTKSQGLMVLGTVFLGSVIMLVSFMYSFMYAISLVQIRAMHIFPTAMFVTGCLAVFVYGAFKTGGVLFLSKDYDLLMSMPIKSSHIILTKVIYLYISDLIFALLFMLPCLFVWQFLEQPPVLNFVMTLVATVFIPAIPIAFAAVLGTVVTYFSGKTRHKNLAAIAANLVFVIGVLYFSNVASRSVVIADYTVDLLAVLVKRYPIAKMFFNITQGSFSDFVLFILISLSVIVFFTLIISKNFKRVRSRLLSFGVKRNTAKVKYSSQSVFWALIKKEKDRFLSSAVYFINCGISPVFGLLGLLYAVSLGRDYIELFTAAPQMYKLVLTYAPLLPAIVCITGGTAMVSLSLEGENLWIIKHMPLSAYKIFMSKIVFNLLLTLPVAVAIAAAEIVLFKLNFTRGAMCFVFPAAMCLFSAYGGFLLNLAFPNFEWTNETKVVKQSAPVFIVTIFSATFMLFMFWGINLFPAKIHLAVYGVLSLFMFAFVIGVNGYLKQRGEKILRGL